MSKFAEAISDCDWALRLSPNCPKAISNTGHAYKSMGNYTEAEIWYNKLKDVGKPALAQIYLDRLFELKLEKSGKDKISETRDEEFENIKGTPSFARSQCR